MKKILDWKEYAKIARKAVAESCVMVRNEGGTLPLKKGTKVSIFGRMQFHYIKSGTGSGGLVNAPYVVGCLEAFESNEEVVLNTELLEIYKEWVEENPFDRGIGWAQEPWCQKEMELTDEIVKKACDCSDVAIVVIGRQAGEDRDNDNSEGSYLLTDKEEEMIALVTKYFAKVVVLLNVGNIMDMRWVDKYQPQSVLYIWQGGCEGGNGVYDVLMGHTSPSGKLTDTIAYEIEDYPSTKNFGNKDDNVYEEDIYVGYRYFETFRKERVQYPFGYGLSYTKFELQDIKLEHVSDFKYQIATKVENGGDRTGKEVVQVYLNPPQGKLGKPLRNLIAFGKTNELSKGEAEQITLQFDLKDFASYDDSGVTGFQHSYVLEKGQYEIYVGTDVRNSINIGEIAIEKTMQVEQLQQACAPIQAFERIKPMIKEGNIEQATEDVPLRADDYIHFGNNNLLKAEKYNDESRFQLKDVKSGNIDLDTFLEQLSLDELVYMTRGEGMCSPKVTPGTAGAIGGVTESLLAHGIPLACCADGPSGIRMDCGAMAYSLPNGTALASTFNEKLNTELFEYLGMEMSLNQIDALLGPGINIHRNPLNGRNFEYFSEDPLLTGRMASAQLKGLHKYKVTGTIKHFACNNQEYARSISNSVISERALREIYLKGYEMAVKEAGAYSIMSSYGALNGVWTASNYSLLTTILREEWGFEGIVMTDWWAKMNEEGKEASVTNTPAMIRAQNDVYMVVDCAEKNSMNDETPQGIQEGSVTRELLVRNAKNICNFLMKSTAIERMNGEVSLVSEEINRFQMDETRCTKLPEIEQFSDMIEVDCSGLDTSKGASAKFYINVEGEYTMKLKLSANVSGIAQVPIAIYLGNKAVKMITLNSQNCKNVETEIKNLNIYVNEKEENYIKLFFAEGGMEIQELKIMSAWRQ